ncbi:MFS transporter [uncultured Porphyromonas sp.]|uniref:MFS transporter n=1 Tax=uncultured Porphyromonas sp. TaxID=159274 RepID=UPI0026385F1E|nr:MFS transporter [uncultured Porphyromonas sp.]
MTQRTTSLFTLSAVMLSFFAMGFVDLVGIASNYVQKDLGLSDSEANLFPSLVFFWFLLCSVPTSMLMNRIGRKSTVLVSLILTVLSLFVPLLGESYWVMLLSFSLLGIGNAIMQTSLNPLLSDLISPDKLASSLTFGQFVKAIASFLAPLIASWGATQAIPELGLGWRILFPIYATIGILSVLALNATRLEHETASESVSFAKCLGLLGRPTILLCFLGIMCHVGIDVGTNTVAPKILMERLGLSLNEAAFATMLYFIFRTAGCLTGSILLRRFSSRSLLGLSALMMLVAMGILTLSHQAMLLYIAIALVGLGNSNVFPIIFAEALGREPEHKNEVSGLMIMGVFGGTVFPLLMGYASDWMGQTGAVLVKLLGVLYLLFLTTRLKK